MLYVRMIFILIISLYTSRVILRELGVVDFGINNVVAGMVTMFTFLNSTLASGTQRFITFALGEHDIEKSKNTFSTTFLIHLVLSVILGLVILIGGLYFINYKLIIPAERMDAAMWVFYSSVIIVILNITQVPYSASIIAHEDMGIYAYMSIFDAAAKLAIVFALSIGQVDKLKLYAVLLACVQMCDILFYRFFCIRKYEECHVRLIFDKELAKEIFVFSGWNIFGCTSVMLNNQGMSMLLNMFFGPVLNAARGISNQVNNVTSQFVSNFQIAVDPQIVKYYAENEIEKMRHLIYNNARLAGLLVLYIILPLSVELPFVLKVWLVKYPDETVFLTHVILIQTLITCMGRGVVMGIHATGKMKVVNLLAGTELLLILPISYVLLRLGCTLHTVMIVGLIPWMVETLIELILMRKYVGLSLVQFYKNTYGMVLLIGVLLFIPVFIVHSSMDEGWLRLIAVCALSATWGAILIYRLGLTQHMRQLAVTKIKQKLHIK